MGAEGEHKRNGKKKGIFERHDTCHQVSRNMFSQHGPFYMQSNLGHEVQTRSISRKNIYVKVDSETNIQGLCMFHRGRKLGGKR